MELGKINWEKPSNCSVWPSNTWIILATFFKIELMVSLITLAQWHGWAVQTPFLAFASAAFDLSWPLLFLSFSSGYNLSHMEKDFIIQVNVLALLLYLLDFTYSLFWSELSLSIWLVSWALGTKDPLVTQYSFAVSLFLFEVNSRRNTFLDDVKTAGNFDLLFIKCSVNFVLNNYCKVFIIPNLILIFLLKMFYIFLHFCGLN